MTPEPQITIDLPENIPAGRKHANHLPRFDKNKALKLRTQHNLSYQQIGDLEGVSRQAVWQRIKNLEPTQETETFKKHRHDIFAKLQCDILNTLDIDDIKAGSMLQRVTAAGILYDKERLETGKSSTNISILIGEIEALQKGE